MFDKNEKVCVLNEFGKYVPGVFVDYIDEKMCTIMYQKNGLVNVLTELISNVEKMSEVIKGFNQHIGECYAMIDHYIALNDKNEIAYWRRALQYAKLQKRSLKDT